MSSEVAELDRPVDELPDGWRSLRLGDVARLGGGTTPSRNEAGYWDGGLIPWATPSDITSLSSGVSTIDSTESMVSERALAECSLPLNPPGTVLMTSRATIGFAAINTVPMTTNQGFITFGAGRDLNPEFLLHWLIAQRPNLVAAAGGSTFKELSRSTAKLLPILLPPLDEQRRIAEVLRSVDEAIATASLVISQANEAFEAVLADLFACYGDASTKLESYCLAGGLQTGPFGSQLKAQDYVDVGVPVIMPVDLTPNGMDFVAAKKAPVAKSRELARHILQPGDVLFARRGEIGRCGLYLEGDPVAMCGTGCLRARLDTAKIDPALAYFLIQSRQARDWLCSHAVGATMPNLNTMIIGELPMPDIPKVEQSKWVDALLMIEGSRRINQRTLAALYETKTVLMSDLLSGRVRVSL